MLCLAKDQTKELSASPDNAAAAAAKDTKPRKRPYSQTANIPETQNLPPGFPPY